MYSLLLLTPLISLLSPEHDFHTLISDFCLDLLYTSAFDQSTLVLFLAVQWFNKQSGLRRYIIYRNIYLTLWPPLMISSLSDCSNIFWTRQNHLVFSPVELLFNIDLVNTKT